jgi:hypothetical protein
MRSFHFVRFAVQARASAMWNAMLQRGHSALPKGTEPHGNFRPKGPGHSPNS